MMSTNNRINKSKTLISLFILSGLRTRNSLDLI